MPVAPRLRTAAGPRGWRRPGDAPRVAVYRSRFLPRSETFVRDHLLRMPRYETRALTSEVITDPLPVPGVEPVLPRTRAPGPRLAAAVLRRTGAPAEQVAAPALAAALRSTRADLVHAHFGVDAAWVLPAVRRTGLPLITTFHGYDATKHPDVLRQRYGGALLVDTFDDLVHRSARIVAVSEYIRGRLVARGAPADKIHVIPCGVDPDRVPEASPAPAHGPLLFVGRLTEKKGVGDLIEALAGVADAPELVVVGDGPLRTTLEKTVSDLRVRARFVGVRTSDQVGALMDAASAVCLPSKTAPDGDCEGLPVTALEAGLHGRPVVGYSHSGIPEAVLHDRTGLLAAEGDIAGLRQELVRACGDTELRRRLGAAARDRVTGSFSHQQLLGQLADLYDAVVSER